MLPAMIHVPRCTAARLRAAGLCAALAIFASPAAAQDDARPLSGLWRGSYVCGQGLTGLELELRGTRYGIVNGVFRFFPVAENPDVPRGSYPLLGRLERGSLVLTPVDVRVLPEGYIPVGIQGVVRAGPRIDGWIDGLNCAGMAVERVSQADHTELLDDGYGAQRWEPVMRYPASLLSLDARELPSVGGSTARIWVRLDYPEGDDEIGTAPGQADEYEMEFDCPAGLSRVWTHVTRDAAGNVARISLTPRVDWLPLTGDGSPEALAFERACAAK